MGDKTLLLACLVITREQDAPYIKTDRIDWLELSMSAFNTILDLNLDECWKTKPLMNGKAVVEALKLPRGPMVSSYLEEQTRWMLLNPTGTKQECEQHLHSVKRQREGEGGEDGSKIGEPAAQQARLK